MVDPAGNIKKEVENNEENYNKENISNAYFSSYITFYTIFSNIKKNIEESELNDHKEVDIEITGYKNEPTGISFEFFNFDKTKKNEFYEQNVEYIKEGSLILSFNFELKEEEDYQTIKLIFDNLKKIVNNIPNDIFNNKTLFRKKGKKISFDIIQNNENLKNDENNNGSSNNNLNIGIKTGINIKDIFSENSDHFKNLVNALSALFKFKAKGTSLNIIILFISECLKIFQLGYETLVSMLIKINEFLNGINISFGKTEFKLEYDPKSLANEIVKKICLLLGKKEDQFQKILQEYIDIVKIQIRNLLLSDNNLLNLIKKINIDYFSFSTVSSLSQLGLAIILKIPGLYDFFITD